MNPEKLPLQSADGAQINLDMLYQIAPSCFTEARGADGKVRRVVNFDVLRQLLGDAAADTGEEFYQFSWPGKAEARREAARSIRKTLRPVPEDSVEWNTTQNLYIEGDNLEVLKLLQKSYMGKVKMIYIDPPYNTGNDFVYHDDFSSASIEHERAEGNIDELGNRYRRNSDSNGRFHSDWCSMIYPRLLIARTLLSDDGVIFISIDDHEVDNMKKICNEIFGEQNFVNCIAVKMSEATSVKMAHARKRFPKLKEYLLFYKMPNFSEFELIDKYISGIWDKENNLYLEGLTHELREKMDKLQEGIENQTISPKKVQEINNCLKNIRIKSLASKKKELGIKEEDFEKWAFENSFRIAKTAGSTSLLNTIKKTGRVSGQDVAVSLSPKGILFYYITNFNESTRDPRLRLIFADLNLYKNPCDFWQDIKTSGAISEEGGVKYNNGKKPLKLLSRIIKMTTKTNDIVLDFFSGSATTAHAVMVENLNQSVRNRSFIMVQLDENLDHSFTSAQGETKETIKDTIAFLDSIHKPHLLTELGKERIRRAGRKIKEEAGLQGQDLDTGFRVFRVDESNQEDVYFHPSALSQNNLGLLLNNIKSDRTDLDLLFGAMLDWGVKLSLPMSKASVDGCLVYTVNDGDLVACFADNITENVIAHIADQSPLRVLFRDSCFNSDADKINIFEQFKQRLGWSDEEAMKNIRVI